MASKPATSRARKPDEKADRDEALARTRRIIEMMTSLRWVPGVSSHLLAEEWGVSQRAVEHYATQANRVIRLAYEPEEIQGALLAKIAAIGDDALKRTEEVVDKDGCVHEIRKPDHRSALRAVELVTELLGLKVQKHEVNHNLAELSDDQLLERAQRWIRKLAEPIEAEGEPIQ